MLWSKSFIPTLKDLSKDTEAKSHALLLKGGFIRQLHSGHYSLLPLGLKVHNKIADIVRAEIESIGGQEFLLPVMHPANVWEQSGRIDTMGDIMFRLDDRKDSAMVLGVTHEEIFSTVASELTSYRQLPQVWYQIQLKFRDEARPKSGLLRVREFAMKDSYSFDIDQAGLDKAFDAHHAAYTKIFDRFGLKPIAVEASNGAMGGNNSIEFMVPSPVGEDQIAYCDGCGYAANIETATSSIEALAEPDLSGELAKFDTPGVTTIDDLVRFDEGAPAERQIKTLVMAIDDSLVLVLLRGDHALNEQKLADATQAKTLRPAHFDEIKSLLNASPGSLGAVNVKDCHVIADAALQGRTNMVTGANIDGQHYRGVSVERDINVSAWFDLRQVGAGENCASCGQPLRLITCIEAGHIFKLGTTYSEAFNVKVADSQGNEKPVVMGSYGIGIGRNMAVIAETFNDEKGLLWPTAVAPFEVVITTVKTDEVSLAASEKIYNELLDQSVDILWDDRDIRPGVKFAEAELIGVPYRITIGPRSLTKGEVEFTERASGTSAQIAVDAIAQRILELLRPTLK